MSHTDEAIILAGGFGTRLRSVVSDVPKPLAPVNGRPFVAWLLDALAAQGFRRVVLATGYMGDLVATTLGERWHGMRLQYAQEGEPLGTGGAIAAAALRLTGDAFMVLNGDTWLALDYAKFDQSANARAVPLAMALATVPDTARYGAVRVDANHVTQLVEKGAGGAGYINAGVYRLQRTLLASFPPGPRFSFENDVLVPAVARGVVGAWLQTRDFIDIGIPEDYLRAGAVLPAFAS